MKRGGALQNAPCLSDATVSVPVVRGDPNTNAPDNRGMSLRMNVPGPPSEAEPLRHARAHCHPRGTKLGKPYFLEAEGVQTQVAHLTKCFPENLAV